MDVQYLVIDMNAEISNGFRGGQKVGPSAARYLISSLPAGAWTQKKIFFTLLDFVRLYVTGLCAFVHNFFHSAQKIKNILFTFSPGLIFYQTITQHSIVSFFSSHT